jgi:hypothetical protein
LINLVIYKTPVGIRAKQTRQTIDRDEGDKGDRILNNLAAIRIYEKL